MDQAVGRGGVALYLPVLPLRHSIPVDQGPVEHLQGRPVDLGNVAGFAGQRVEMALLVRQPVVDLGGVVAGLAATQAVFAGHGRQAIGRVALGELMQRPGQVIRGGQPARVELEVCRPARRTLFEIDRVVQGIVAIHTAHDAIGMDVEGVRKAFLSGQVESAVVELLRRNHLPGPLGQRAAFRLGHNGKRTIEIVLGLAMALRAVGVPRLADVQQPLVGRPVRLEHERIPLPLPVGLDDDTAGAQARRIGPGKIATGERFFAPLGLGDVAVAHQAVHFYPAGGGPAPNVARAEAHEPGVEVDSPVFQRCVVVTQWIPAAEITRAGGPGMSLAAASQLRRARVRVVTG